MTLKYELELKVLAMYQHLHTKNELSDSILLKVGALQTPRSDQRPCQAAFVDGKNETCFGQISRHFVNVSKLEVGSHVSR